MQATVAEPRPGPGNPVKTGRLQAVKDAGCTGEPPEPDRHAETGTPGSTVTIRWSQGTIDALPGS